MNSTTKTAHTHGLTVKCPIPARFPAYRIVSVAGEVLATVPITASGDSNKLAWVMAAAPNLLSALSALADAADSHVELCDEVEAARIAIAEATGGAE